MKTKGSMFVSLICRVEDHVWNYCSASLNRCSIRHLSHVQNHFLRKQQKPLTHSRPDLIKTSHFVRMNYAIIEQLLDCIVVKPAQHQHVPMSKPQKKVLEPPAAPFCIFGPSNIA